MESIRTRKRRSSSVIYAEKKTIIQYLKKNDDVNMVDMAKILGLNLQNTMENVGYLMCEGRVQWVHEVV